MSNCFTVYNLACEIARLDSVLAHVIGHHDLDDRQVITFNFYKTWKRISKNGDNIYSIILVAAILW